MNNIESITAVYNDVELIEITLESIEPIVDRIHIVEGSWFPGQPTRSSDGTIEAIERFKARYPEKVNIIYYDYNPNIFDNRSGLSNPNAIANSIAARQMALDQINSIWYFMVDSDEVYKKEDLLRLKEYLKDYEDLDLPLVFNIPSFVFYFDLDFGAKDDFHRIHKIIDKNPKLIGEDLLKYDNFDSPERIFLTEDIIKMYHYSYLSKKRVETKIKFYDKDHASWWYKNVYCKNMDNKSLIKEHENYHLFAGHGFNRDYIKFNDKHPKLIEERLIKNANLL